MLYVLHRGALMTVLRNECINVCVSCDDNYSQYAGVVIASILYNAAENDKLNFFVLDGGISEEHKKEILSLKYIKDCNISFVKINDELFEEYKKIKTHSYITLPACYRLRLSSLLPDIDRIIYFDCDIVVNSSLSALFNIDMGNYSIAGVKDINRRMLLKSESYINSGVLLLDLNRWRKNNVEEKLFEFTKANVNNIKKGDQEIINRCMAGDIKVIDDVWNVQSSNFTNRSSYTNKPKVVHFVAQKKPWHWASLSYHRDLYFKYLQLTPWKLSENDLEHWTKDNQIASLFAYLKYRPFFFLRPRFYEAVFKTYIKPIFEPKQPIIKSNTFIVWEPCSKSHSEVVPGYVKYLVDLGYHVSVICHTARFKEGLFARFKDEKVSLNKMNRKQVIKYFQKSDLSDVSGVLVTTVGKLCDEIHFEDAYKMFNENADKSKIYFVAHEAVHAVDANTWNKKLITLRELNYKGAESVVVNPHYFGKINILPKNDITNFVMVGAIKSYKKNDNTIINAVRELDKEGIRNFKITVIGKGHIRNIPPNIRKYFDMKGRLSFKKMYNELEKADFLLTAYDVDNPAHVRYNTTGTSGNFQLVYGFTLLPVIIKEFAQINRFTSQNAILYSAPANYSDAMERAINMTKAEYAEMENELKKTADEIYSESLKNLKDLIND